MAFCPRYPPQTLGYASMLTLEKRIQQWKKWINRNKNFTTEELEELENHLREEILYLTEHDKVPDQKAFDQALDILGEKGLLDEEFGKIRKSKFDKVKLWAYAQTIVIVGLVVFISVPYITPYFRVQSKDFSEDLIGENVGKIYGWNKEKFGNAIQNITTFQEYTYFITNGVLLRYESDIGSNESFSKCLGGSYFSSTPTFVSSFFDFDAQKNLYWWTFDGSQILRFNDAQPKGNISLPEMDPMVDLIGLKVIGNYLLLFVTVPHFSPEGQGSFTMDYAISSYVYICDVTSKEKKFDKILIQNPIAWVDRSDDELAILFMNGEIATYSVQNKKMILKHKWMIANYSTYFSSISYAPLLFSKKGNQMVLKKPNIPYEYYFIKPVSENELMIIPLLDKNIEGFFKSNYMGIERLVIIKSDPSVIGYDSLYLFKE
jgi:hypothetical protein